MIRLCFLTLLIIDIVTSSNLEIDYCDDNETTSIFDNSSSHILTNEDDAVTFVDCINGTKFYGCRMSGLRDIPVSSFFNKFQIINYGETVIIGNFLLLCQKSFPLTNQTAFVRIGCFVDNRVLAPGQTYRNSTEYYECTNDASNPSSLDNNIDLRKSGCVDQYGQMAALNTFHDMDDYRYKCLLDEASGKFVLFPYSCLMDDVEYKVNDHMIISDYWYVCKRTTDHLTISPGGCIVDYGFIRIGEIFHSKGYIGRCDLVKNTIIQGANKIDLQMIGCLAKSVNGTYQEHLVDDRWLEVEQKGTKFSIEMACVQITSKRVMKLATRCSMPNLRSTSSEPIYLKPNCFTRINHTLWTCHKTIFGNLVSSVTENAGMQDTANAIMSGLKYC